MCAKTYVHLAETDFQNLWKGGTKVTKPKAAVKYKEK